MGQPISSKSSSDSASILSSSTITSLITTISFASYFLKNVSSPSSNLTLITSFNVSTEHTSPVPSSVLTIAPILGSLASFSS